jgi:hypothetical protein
MIGNGLMDIIIMDHMITGTDMILVDSDGFLENPVVLWYYWGWRN